VTPGLLLPLVLVSFAANSLVTRYVVDRDLLDAGLLTAVRFVAGAVALLLVAAARREPVRFRRQAVVPAVWLGAYAVCISYGYLHIGAAPGTFVFYAAVLGALVAVDLRHGTRPSRRRAAGAALGLVGVGVLASSSLQTVTALGVLLLALTGAAWGLYTAAGRGAGDPRQASTENFAVLALVLAPLGALGAAAGLPVTVEGVAWGVVMGAGTTALAYVAWYACQPALTGAQAGLVQLAIPVLTTAGAVVLLGEALSVLLLVAAVLVGAGMWLGSAAPARARG
jgi:drug/metabolite transporter (DMT)-like permease